MSQDQIAFAYLAATMLALGLGMGGGTDKPIAGCAVLIGLIYALSAAVHTIVKAYGLPELIGFMPYPLYDLIGALTAMALWRAGAGMWAVVLAFAFWLQIGLAAGFGLTSWTRFGDAVFLRDTPAQFDALFRTYKGWNNSVYIVELLTLSVVGGRHVLDRLYHWMVGFRGPRRLHLRWPGHSSPLEGA